MNNSPYLGLSQPAMLSPFLRMAMTIILSMLFSNGVVAIKRASNIDDEQGHLADKIDLDHVNFSNSEGGDFLTAGGISFLFLFSGLISTLVKNQSLLFSFE